MLKYDENGNRIDNRERIAINLLFVAIVAAALTIAVVVLRFAD